MKYPDATKDHAFVMRSALLMCGAIFTGYFGWLVVWAHRAPAVVELGVILFSMAFLLWGLYESYCVALAHERRWRELYDYACRNVDPWRMQRILMEASDQRIPQTPRLHKGVLLYAALQAEELGEEFEALHTVLSRVTPLFPHDRQGTLRDKLQELMFELHMELTDTSKAMRKLLEELELDVVMEQKEAIDLFDATTDIAVVNSGFALSCGFDGSAGYLEVATSNHSKINPATGKIDKDGGGKWIKGPNYRAPDLALVLLRTSPLFSARLQGRKLAERGFDN